MGKKISDQDGVAGLKRFLAASGPIDMNTKMLVSRYLLELIENKYPGHAVELRIPPAGAVQILAGVRHRRGTPPAVVEMGMEDWINLAIGVYSWDELIATARIQRSGERSHIANLFPLIDTGLM